MGSRENTPVSSDEEARLQNLRDIMNVLNENGKTSKAEEPKYGFRKEARQHQIIGGGSSNTDDSGTYHPSRPYKAGDAPQSSKKRHETSKDFLDKDPKRAKTSTVIDEPGLFGAPNSPTGVTERTRQIIDDSDTNTLFASPHAEKADGKRTYARGSISARTIALETDCETVDLSIRGAKEQLFESRKISPGVARLLLKIIDDPDTYMPILETQAKEINAEQEMQNISGTDHPEPPGCTTCEDYGRRCQLLDADRWPCEFCREIDADRCEVDGARKSSCYKCQRGKLECSYEDESYDTSRPCQHCLDESLDCRAPPKEGWIEESRFRQGERQAHHEGQHEGTFIATKLAHPLKFETSSCHWCDSIYYGLVGMEHEMNDDEFVDRGNGFVPVDPNHSRHGRAETRMCANCVSERIQILKCSMHVMEAMDNVQPESEGLQLTDEYLNEYMADQAPFEWCSICTGVHATMICSVCNLKLCEYCEKELRVKYGGNLGGLIARLHGTRLTDDFLIRADAALLHPKGELSRML